ncbi:phosphate transport system substrate-binding protein [Gammaproteobacteria bacterium]
MKQRNRLISIKWLMGIILVMAFTPLPGQAVEPSLLPKPAVEPQVLPPERATGQVMYIIGSTLMKDYTVAIMERLVKNAGLVPGIIVTKGTTRGIEAFCSGTGLDTPDVVALSRRMRSSELEDCRAHGVTDIIEIPVGYEAAGIVSRRDDQDYPLTLVSMYKAVAAELPKDFNDFIPNTYSRWHEVDPSLPNTEIRMIVPVRSLGGRAFLEDRMLQGACRKIMEIKTIFDSDTRVKQCISMREDGRTIELDTPYDRNVVQTLASSPPGTLAVIPLRFATEHQEFLKLQPFDGVVPNHETVAQRQYPFTRPLYYLVKRAHVKNYRNRGLVSGLREFITETTRESTMGPSGYLAKLGVFPLEPKIRDQIRVSSLRLTILDR